MAELTFPGKIVALSAVLEKAKIPYAFGGAIALAYYAAPRATSDIDLHVFVVTADFDRVAKLMGQLGIDVSVGRTAIERDGQCRLPWGSVPVDLFMSNVEFHAVMQRAVRKQPFGEATICVLAPEHLIVCKALFNRPKDWLDIEQIVLTMPELDQAEIAGWLERMVGKRDERTLRFRRLASAAD